MVPGDNFPLRVVEGLWWADHHRHSLGHQTLVASTQNTDTIDSVFTDISIEVEYAER